MSESKKIEIYEKDFKTVITEALTAFSDGLEWRLLTDDEDSGTPLVMASPDEISDFLVKYFFNSDPESSDGEDSSTPAT